ncbi:MAG: hypothetical protein GY679_02015 [Mycoplasma sp.]|nr:hypothetical protein [Mycoplasma sp.]
MKDDKIFDKSEEQLKALRYELGVYLNNKSKFYKPLRNRYKMFVSYYVIYNFDSVGAALVAGYTQKRAAGAAGKLLSQENIRGAVAEFIEVYINKLNELTELNVVKQYMLEATYDPADIINADGSPKFNSLSELGEKSRVIVGIESKYFGKGEDRVKQTTVKLADRNKALQQLARYKKLIREQIQIDVSNATGVLKVEPTLTEEEWEAQNSNGDSVN